MSSFVRLLVASSCHWRSERWLATPGNRTGFRPRNLGRFLEDAFDESEVPMVLWNRLSLYRLLRDVMSEPPSLQQCCRMVARQQLAIGGRLFAKIDSLQYPVALKNFMKLRDVDWRQRKTVCLYTILILEYLMLCARGDSTCEYAMSHSS